MLPDSQSQYVQQIEHLMTTVITCRSVLRYNLPLSDEQKKDLQGDLDIALDVLRSYLVPAPPLPPAPVPDPVPLPDGSSSHSAEYLPVSSLDGDTRSHTGVVPVHDHEQTLHALYRMYHAFLNARQPVNLNSFVSRFNEIMATLNELQQLFEGERDSYQTSASDGKGEEALQRVRIFIADLYYIFMEFMRALSETLQKNNVQLDTEKVSSLSRETLPPSAPPTRDLAPLLGVYEAHQRLNEKRGGMNERISDTTAFLEFLKEGLDRDIHVTKRGEIQSQLVNMGRLLHELARLLTEYEKATAGLFLR